MSSLARVSTPSALPRALGVRLYASGKKGTAPKKQTQAAREQKTVKAAFRKVKDRTIKERDEFPKGARLGFFHPLPSSMLPSAVDPELHTRLEVSALDLALAKNAGAVAKLGVPGEGPIRWFGVPKNIMLEFRFLSQPCAVIRDVTVYIANMLLKSAQFPSTDSRAVICGKPGSGKSFLLLQMVQHCYENDWLVLYFPRAHTLVNSTTPYSYDIRTKTYLQPVFALRTLQRFSSTNSSKLSTVLSVRPFILDRREIAAGTPLSEIIEIAVREPVHASVILEAVIEQVSLQTQHPVLLAVDGLQTLYSPKSIYRDPQFHPIRPYHLALPRLILEFASGRRSFARGAVLGALSSDPLFPIPLELQDRLEMSELGLPGTTAHPSKSWHKRDSNMSTYTNGLQPVFMPEKFSLSEAAAVFETWALDNALAVSPGDGLFMSKYAESCGNPRDFVWKGILGSLEGDIPSPPDAKTLWPQLKLLA